VTDLRTIILELNPSGHRFHYVRLIAEGLSEVGLRPVIVTSARAVASPEFDVHLRRVAGLADIDASVHFPEKRGWALAGTTLQALRGALTKHRPHHAYLPFADGVAQRLALEGLLRRSGFLSQTRIEGLLFRGEFAYPRTRTPRDFVKDRVTEYLISRVPRTSLHLLDPLVYEHVKSISGHHRLAVTLVPEPVEMTFSMSSSESRDVLGLERSGKYVVCVGGISRRKGTDLVLRAFQDRRIPSASALLLFGPHDEHTRSLLRGPFADAVRRGEIVSRDGYLPQSTIEHAVSAADVVALPYRRHVGSSGVLTRAAAARKTIVGQEYGWIGECIRRFELGYTCDPESIRDLSATLERALKKPVAQNSDARRFVAFNRPENFKAAWMTDVRRRLGLPPKQATKTWDWVLANQ